MTNNLPVVAPFDLTSLLAHNLQDPAAAQDAASKNYVDSNTGVGYYTEWNLATSGYASGAWHLPITASSTPNVGTAKGLTLSGIQNSVTLGPGTWDCQIHCFATVQFIAALSNTTATTPSGTVPYTSVSPGLPSGSGWCAGCANRKIISTSGSPAVVVPWVFLASGTTVNYAYIAFQKTSA
jgi:hypothetical protein